MKEEIIEIPMEQLNATHFYYLSGELMTSLPHKILKWLKNHGQVNHFIEKPENAFQMVEDFDRNVYKVKLLPPPPPNIN